MADNLLLIASSIKGLKKKIKEIKNLPKECENLSNILDKIEPIIDSLKNSLIDKYHIQLFDSFEKVLQEAGTIVDSIHDHPISSSIFSGKYKSKIDIILEKINSWLIRIQSMADAETLILLNHLIEVIEQNKNSLQKELTNIDTQMEDIKKDIKTMPLETIKLLKGELNVFFNNPDKSSKYINFLDEEDKNLLIMVQNQEAQLSSALDSFYCPITKDVMTDPVICTVSGNTYEKKAIYKYFSTCIEKGLYPEDPFTKEKVNDIVKDVLPNHALKEIINNWYENCHLESLEESHGMIFKKKEIILKELEEKVKTLENQVQTLQQVFIGTKNKTLFHVKEKKTEHKFIPLIFDKYQELIDLRCKKIINDGNCNITENISFIPYSLLQCVNIKELYISFHAMYYQYFAEILPHLYLIQDLNLYNVSITNQRLNFQLNLPNHYFGIIKSTMNCGGSIVVLTIPQQLKILRVYFDTYTKIDNWSVLYEFISNAENYEESNICLNTIEFHNVSCNLKTLTDDIYDGNNYQKRDKNLKIQHFFMSRIKFFED